MVIKAYGGMLLGGNMELRKGVGGLRIVEDHMVWVFGKAIILGFDSFVNQTRFKVGRGNRVKFWKDVWCGNRPLMEEFPCLFEDSGE